MTNFKQRIEEITSQIQAIKTEFEQYISDTSIPLDERWEVFTYAPSELRGHSPWVERFDGIPKDFVGHDGYVWAERYQTIYVTEILERYDDIIHYPDDFDLKAGDFDIIAFKEGVLKRNIGSFDYDW